MLTRQSSRNESGIIARAEKGFCSGCGVCAAICPQGSLEMRFNAIGEYLPCKVAEKCNQCGLCRKACPFVDDNPNEDEHGKALYSSTDGMRHCLETGYYHECFVGFAPNEAIRWAGSSGGMLTWTLCELLRRGKIDHVVCVKPCPDPKKLYQFSIVSTQEEVLAGSKSAYYPVELSQVVRRILDLPGRYAVVGLPCVCKAIRNAQRFFPQLKKRVCYVLGLVCAGQQANARYADAIAEMAGLNEEMICIRFREKKPKNPTENMLFLVHGESGQSAEASFFDGVKELWASGAFRLSGCNYCDDAFAECADAAFMDAWLPEYTKDSAGHNIVLSRDPALSDLLRSVDALEPIGIDLVVRSQAVHAKRESLNARIFLNRIFGKTAPEKRGQLKVPSVKILVKTALKSCQYYTARKNLASGKAYNAYRPALLPVVLIEHAGSVFRKLMKRNGSQPMRR